MAVGLTAAFPRTFLFDTEAYGSWQRDSARPVDIVSGCFFLVRRDLWNRLGGFDLRYYMYGEEADLCLRARRLGHHPMITPTAQIMHLVGAASSSLAGKRLLVTKARVTLIRDHWPAWQVPIGIGLMWMWGALRVVATKVTGPIAGKRGQSRKAYWAEVWAKRQDWLRGY